MNHSQGRGGYMCDKEKREQEKDTGEQVSKRTKQAEWLILPCVWLR
jgi:hypothetical protein